LSEINQRGEDMAKFLDRLDAHGGAWSTALGDLNRAHLDAFLAAHPDISARLALSKVRKLHPRERRILAADLLQMLVPWTESDAKQLPRLERLIDATASVDEIIYRTEVRLAALLRIRTIILNVAGRFHVRSQPRQAAALAALEECEDLRLSFRPDRSARPPAKMPLPALEADEKAAQRLRPAWLGFHFEPASTATRKRLSMPDGAVRVLSIVPQSPAATAGLRPGDFLVGAAGEPFTRANPIRPHVVLAPLDGEWSLDIQRGRERQTLRLRPQVAPDNAPVDRTRTVRKRP